MIFFLITAIVFMCVVMAAAFACQRRWRNGGWTDVFWIFGMGATGFAAALSFPYAAGISARQFLVACLVTAWSLRLGFYVLRRVARSPEDARYVMLREVVGGRFNLVMFWYLQAQAWVGALLALSIFVAAHNPAQGLGLMDLFAAGVFSLGVAGESLADRALSRFKSDPRNKGAVLDRGLWGWMRHPNYFFEWLVWLAYPLFAIDPAGRYVWGWLALSAPVIMYLVLRHMSGVPALEAALTATKGEAYRAYQARVGPFFPRPPRRAPSPLSARLEGK